MSSPPRPWRGADRLGVPGLPPSPAWSTVPYPPALPVPLQALLSSQGLPARAKPYPALRPDTTPEEL